MTMVINGMIALSRRTLSTLHLDLQSHGLLPICIFQMYNFFFSPLATLNRRYSEKNDIFSLCEQIYFDNETTVRSRHTQSN